MELLNQTDLHPNSIWGKISNAINGRNRPLLRKKIYIKWVRNVSRIQDYVNKHFEAISIHPKVNVSVPASNKNRPETCKTGQVRPVSIIQPPQNLSGNEDLQIRYELERLTVQFRASLFSKRILRDISTTTVDSNLNSVSNLTQFFRQINITCVESELTNGHLFTLWASGSCDIDSYLECVKDVKSRLSEREIDRSDNLAYFNNCDSQIWFDGIRHYECTNEENIHIHNGSILFKKDYIFDVIRNFVNVFTGKYKSKLLERSQIMSLWLMHKNLDNHQCVYLWGKYYIWITQSEIANFIGWINGLRVKNKTFYIEIKKHVY